ncbi:MAG: zinc ribbon domain-containing protein [Euryarchaeota archaeon]|nr:zinc ribbon domain-containing protein [Euryarchaeota archaeon]
MENKSGFKECSRCGLRNKPTAKQCDFCGQKFEAVDEWEMQLDRLEKMNRETKRVEVTEDVSKRIRSTILRKEPEKKPEPIIEERPFVAVQVEAPSEEKMPVAEPPRPEPSPEQREQTTLMTFTATEARPIELEEDKKVVEEAPVVVIEVAAVEEKATPIIVVPETVTEPAPEKMRGRKIVKKETFRRSTGADKGIFKWKFDAKNRKSVVFMLVLLAGVGLYIASIAMSSTLGTMGAWSIVALSGVMIVIGFAQIAIDWNPADHSHEMIEHHEIVMICPNCNEKVGTDEEVCPACGTEFDPSEL